MTVYKPRPEDERQQLTSFAYQQEQMREEARQATERCEAVHHTADTDPASQSERERLCREFYRSTCGIEEYTQSVWNAARRFESGEPARIVRVGNTHTPEITTEG